MNKGLLTVLIIVGIIAVFAMTMVGGYNNLVTLNENIDGKWSQVNNQLQRRADLIPNLVQTVKGYAAHEESILKSLADARSKLIGAQTVQDKAAADQELSGALSRLLVVVENYPTLKADANFRQLQDELAGTENRIATARKDYNDAVQVYNTRIKRFPAVLYAGMFGFSPREYFQIQEGAQNVPNVDFSQK